MAPIVAVHSALVVSVSAKDDLIDAFAERCFCSAMRLE